LCIKTEKRLNNHENVHSDSSGDFDSGTVESYDSGRSPYIHELHEDSDELQEDSDYWEYDGDNSATSESISTLSATMVPSTISLLSGKVANEECALTSVLTSTTVTLSASSSGEDREVQRGSRRDWFEFFHRKCGKKGHKRRFVRYKICINHPSVVSMHCYCQ